MEYLIKLKFFQCDLYPKLVGRIFGPTNLKTEAPSSIIFPTMVRHISSTLYTIQKQNMNIIRTQHMLLKSNQQILTNQQALMALNRDVLDNHKIVHTAVNSMSSTQDTMSRAVLTGIFLYWMSVLVK